jgi:DNA-directed RNA polymerase subunit M/transcription elongation factor TFIIS
MYTLDDQIDVHCPQCANDTVYVAKLVALPEHEGGAYECRCGKCGWRFRVFRPDPTFLADALP